MNEVLIEVAPKFGLLFATTAICFGVWKADIAAGGFMFGFLVSLMVIAGLVAEFMVNNG